VYTSLSPKESKDWFGRNDKKFARFAYLFWNERSKPFVNIEERKYYGRSKPPSPVLYTTDHPGQAFVMGTIAKNVSLEFRMCMYKASDVPYQMKPGQKLKAKPIHCFEWFSSFIYDHEEKVFSQPSNLSPVCKTPLSP
jgi:hypothetical protein